MKKLAISNIAWPLSEDKNVASVLKEYGVSGIEIAPTKVWQNPIDVPEREVNEYKKFWEQRGFQIVAFQAVLFGHPELTIFENQTTRDATIAYLTKIIHLAKKLGAQVLVFGSPKNRLIGNLAKDEVEKISRGFFSRIGSIASKNGVYLCIEPNPKEYNSDFITNGHDAVELVKMVGSPGFGLHLDTACMTLSGDDVEAVISQGAPYMKHFHVSEPYLGQVGNGGVDLPRFTSALKKVDYPHWISIEMKEQNSPFDIESIRQAVESVKKLFDR
ncbi:MAG: sugar phosphate isomerase/epimerase [bacterium]|nr:sugar phosphate isomerase/epimerase [bacterium]